MMMCQACENPNRAASRYTTTPHTQLCRVCAFVAVENREPIARTIIRDRLRHSVLRGLYDEMTPSEIEEARTAP